MVDEAKARAVEEQKTAMKAALKEWLNEQFNTFDMQLGKYVRHIIVAILFYAVVHSVISFRYSELRQILIDEFVHP